MTDETKECPFCAETIKAKAIVCRYCGRDLPEAGKATLAPSPVPAPTAKKKGSGGVTVFTLLAIVAAIVVLATEFPGCGSDSTPSDKRVTSVPVVKTTYVVEYRVEGTTRAASVVYENAQGGTEMADVRVPWKKLFRMRKGDFAYLSAQDLQGSGTVDGLPTTATVICQIWVDGVKVKESESSGAYKIASCSGSL